MLISSVLFFALPQLALGNPVPALDADSLVLRAPQDEPAYKWSPMTEISTAGEPAFFNATERWDIYAPPSYRISISPANEADVINAIQYAKRHNLPFLATGGRHGYSTSLKALRKGLAIDLSKMNSVHVNKAAATLTIGPGVRFRDIFDPVYAAGFQIQTGTCSCVGMMGATLGGGIGRQLGLNGLIVDALVSARIVTADGKVLTVSKKSNPELFWGIRGAGFNFGIVTEATYKLQPLYKGGVWTSADILLTGDKNVTFFKTLTDLAPLPPQLTVETIMSYNQTLNQSQLALSVVYAGPKAEAVKAMAPILKIKSSYTNIQEVPWNHLSYNTTFGLDAAACMDQIVIDIYGVALRKLSAPTFASVFNTLGKFWAANPAGLTSQVVLETWPIQAAVAVPDDETAYPWRDATTNVLIQFRWDKPGNPVERPSNVAARKIRDDLAATSGYDDLAVYVNYAYGDEKPAQMYGASKLPRLIALKKKYDPNNLFSFYNALPTSGH
ncbi:hypothetical protein F5Y14DRAFT_230862 [Nemania sp. NC0429]|nr:hypothetical protein F5Y14DRAFT_230862 [Nemania sp. NC0429]